MTSHMLIEMAEAIQEKARLIAQIVNRPGVDAFIEITKHEDIFGRMILKEVGDPQSFYLITLFCKGKSVVAVYTTGRLTTEGAFRIQDGAFDINTIQFKWRETIKPHYRTEQDPVKLAVMLKCKIN